MSIGGSSPLTRGKRRPQLAHRLDEPAHPRSRGENALALVSRADHSRLIPAHAGKTHLSASAFTSAKWLIPAHAGKTVQEGGVDTWGWGSSPLTRGKPPHGGASLSAQWLIPAHAGKTNPVAVMEYTATGSSPLTRGKRIAKIAKRRLGLAHPRSRGENRGE